MKTRGITCSCEKYGPGRPASPNQRNCPATGNKKPPTGGNRMTYHGVLIMAIQELSKSEVSVVSGGALDLGGLLGSILTPVLGLLTPVLNLVGGILTTVTGLLGGLLGGL